MLTQSNEFGLVYEESAVFELNKVFHFAKCGFDQVERLLLFREELEEGEETADTVVVECAAN